MLAFAGLLTLIVCVVSGDGTTSQTFQGVMTSERPNEKRLNGGGNFALTGSAPLEPYQIN